MGGVQTFPVFAIGDILPLFLAALTIIIATFTVFLSIAVTVFGAAGTITRAFTITVPAITIAITALIVTVTVTTVIVTVATLVVALIAVIPTRRVISSAARGGRASSAGRSALTTTLTARAGIKSPRSRGGCTRPLWKKSVTSPKLPKIQCDQGETYLNLQKIIASNALVVHLMVGIISVTTALVLDEGKPEKLLRQGERDDVMEYNIQSARRCSGSWNVTANKATIAK